MTNEKLTFHWTSNPEIQHFLDQWRAVESKAQTSVFDSEQWISAWIATNGSPHWVLSVYDDMDLVGISFWTQHQHRRFGFRSNTLHLQHSGDEAKNQIWPEYSGILCLPNYKDRIYQCLVDEVFNAHPSITNIDTGLMKEVDFKKLSIEKHLFNFELSDISYQFVNDPNLSGISKGIRSEVRRTEKGLNQLGRFDVTFEKKQNLCVDQFLQMAKQHQQTWGVTSGYYNKYFTDFHRHLITDLTGAVQPVLSTLWLEDKPIARHYLLLHRQVLYFYLGVGCKMSDARIKPGIYLHAKTIESLDELYAVSYDFLGGDYLYKRRLSNQSVSLVRGRIQRKTMKSVLEKTLRQIKQRFAVKDA